MKIILISLMMVLMLVACSSTNLEKKKSNTNFDREMKYTPADSDSSDSSKIESEPEKEVKSEIKLEKKMEPEATEPDTPDISKIEARPEKKAKIKIKPEKDMILITAGTTSVENGDITVDKDFYIGKYEVTQAQWQSVMVGNKNKISPIPSYFTEKDGTILSNNPVESISWYDVVVFCNKLRIQEGLTPVYSINDSADPKDWGKVPNEKDENWDLVVVDSNANGYRMPTSKEWEYAARGGKDGKPTKYSGSNNLEDVAWYWDNSFSKEDQTRRVTFSVGNKNSNELGIYDMSGNVGEWCFDWHPNYVSTHRMLRGGNWLSDKKSTLSFRLLYNPNQRYSFSGVRLSRLP